MNKKLLKIMSILVSIMLLAGCGASNETGMTTSSFDSLNGYKTEAAEAAVEDFEAESIQDSSSLESVQRSNQKLIKTVDMTLETKEFDNLVKNIKEQISNMNGYIESSNVSGNSYYNQNGKRYAHMTLRIPIDKLDEFVTVIDGLGNVTYKNESIEDVTLQYTDIESHKTALKTEQERLISLLEKAESVEDIITIESRLSEVRYELENYESTMRSLDNKIEYSTVYVDINEVERITEVKERGFFEEIGYRLINNLQEIGTGIKNFVIWFVSSIPYFVIIGCIVLGIVAVTKKIICKKKKVQKKNNDKEV